MYLEPYSLNKDGHYLRPVLNCNYGYGIVRKCSKENTIWYSAECWDGCNAVPFSSKEEAMIATDKVLVKAGFTLLSQEQWDKLQLLI